MNQAEFFDKLRQLLHAVPQEEADEIIRDYEEYFADALADGKREEDIVAALGNLEELMRELDVSAPSDPSDQLHYADRAPRTFLQKLRAKLDMPEWQAFEIRQTFSQDLFNSVEVRTSHANLTVQKSEDDAVHLHVSGEQRSIALNQEQLTAELAKISIRGNILTMACGVSKLVDSRKTKVILWLPDKINGNLSANTVSGDLVLRDLRVKKCSVRSVSGNVRLDNIYCPLGAASSVSGNIFIRQTEIANLTASSVSGNLKLSVVSHTVKTHTTSGNTYFQAALLPEKLDIHTISGNVALRMSEASNLNMTLRTISGSTRVRIPDFTLHKQKGYRFGISGNGKHAIKVKTVSGDFHAGVDESL